MNLYKVIEKDMNTNEQKHMPEIFLQDYTDAYTNIIRRKNDPGLIFCSAKRRTDADLIVKSVNNYEHMQQRIKELEEALRDMYYTLDSDDKVITQYLPEGESSYKPSNWLTKAKALLQSSKQL
jgi:hypothetical protein